MGKITQADLEGKYKSEWESQVSRWVFAYVDAYDAAMKGGACRDGLHMIFYEKLRKVDSDEKKLKLQKNTPKPPTNRLVLMINLKDHSRFSYFL